MSDDVKYIALPPDLTGPWAYFSGKGQVEWARTDDEKSALSGKDISVILPGENIRRMFLDLPGVRGNELQSAINFEIEDRLGGSVSGETLCQDRKKPGHVAIVSNDYKARLTDYFNRYQLDPARIFIDYEVLGEGQNIAIGERLLKGGLEGYAAASGWQDLLSEPIDFTPLQPQALFSKFEAGLNDDEAALLDLRAGLGVKAAGALDWQPWAKLAAVITAIILGPFMLDKYSEARAWRLQADADKTAMVQLYKQATGETPRDVALAISRQLKTRQTSAGFLEMSGVLFAALSDVEGAEIDTMRYDPRQNLVALSIRYPNFEAGEALEQAVTNRGGRLTVGGIRERGDTLVGEASFVLSSGAGS